MKRILLAILAISALNIADVEAMCGVRRQRNDGQNARSLAEIQRIANPSSRRAAKAAYLRANNVVIPANPTESVLDGLIAHLDATAPEVHDLVDANLAALETNTDEASEVDPTEEFRFADDMRDLRQDEAVQYEANLVTQAQAQAQDREDLQAQAFDTMRATSAAGLEELNTQLVNLSEHPEYVAVRRSAIALSAKVTEQRREKAVDVVTQAEKDLAQAQVIARDTARCSTDATNALQANVDSASIEAFVSPELHELQRAHAEIAALRTRLAAPTNQTSGWFSFFRRK